MGVRGILGWFIEFMMEFGVVNFFESCIEEGESFVFVDFWECLCLESLVVFNISIVMDYGLILYVI